MTRLNERQFGAPGDDDKIPNPLFHGRPYTFQEGLGGIPDEAFKRAGKQKVPVDQLIHTQHWLSASKLENMSKRKRIPGETPEVAVINGQFFLHDGHHRATIAHSRAQRTLTSRVAYL